MSDLITTAQNFVLGECERCNESMIQEFVEDRSVLSVGCVDFDTLFGEVNIPGGMMRVWRDFSELFELWFEIRRERSGEFYVHTACGYIYFLCEKTCRKSQEIVIADFSQEVDRLNVLWGCDFKVVVETCGCVETFFEVDEE